MCFACTHGVAMREGSGSFGEQWCWQLLGCWSCIDTFGTVDAGQWRRGEPYAQDMLPFEVD